MSFFYSLLAQIVVFSEENGYSERSSRIDMTLTVSLQEGGMKVVAHKILCDPLYLSLTLRP